MVHTQATSSVAGSPINAQHGELMLVGPGRATRAIDAPDCAQSRWHTAPAVTTQVRDCRAKAGDDVTGAPTVVRHTWMPMNIV